MPGSEEFLKKFVSRPCGAMKQRRVAPRFMVLKRSGKGAQPFTDLLQNQADSLDRSMRRRNAADGRPPPQALRARAELRRIALSRALTVSPLTRLRARS